MIAIDGAHVKFKSFISLFLLLITSNALSANHRLNHAYTDVGQGKPIILIHAFPTDQRLWKPQQDELKKYFRIITLDLRGFGENDKTNGEAVTMTDYANEVKAVMSELHINKTVIGGESMGGYIALSFLQQYPESVEALILSDTQSIADSPETKAKREASAQDVMQNGTAELLAGFMNKALSPNADDVTKSYLKSIVDSQSATGIASALRGMALRVDTSFLLTQTSIPILIISGDKDILIPPQQSINMHALAKNSKLVIIPDAGHLSSLEKPSEWNQSVKEMFS